MAKNFFSNYKKDLNFILFLLVLFALTRFLSQEQYQNKEANELILRQIHNMSEVLQSYYVLHPYLFPFLFGSIFFIITILYIPFTGSFFTLSAGFLFGLTKGILFISFLVSISYTTSFFISRHLFYNYIHKKIGKRGRDLICNFEKDGLTYLLSLRFAGVIPAVIVNMAMGLTKIRTYQFYLITQLGTFPHVVIMLYAGTQLATLKDINKIVPDSVFVCFIILALFPLVYKIILDQL